MDKTEQYLNALLDIAGTHRHNLNRAVMISNGKSIACATNLVVALYAWPCPLPSLPEAEEREGRQLSDLLKKLPSRDAGWRDVPTADLLAWLGTSNITPARLAQKCRACDGTKYTECQDCGNNQLCNNCGGMGVVTLDGALVPGTADRPCYFYGATVNADLLAFALNRIPDTEQIQVFVATAADPVWLAGKEWALAVMPMNATQLDVINERFPA